MTNQRSFTADSNKLAYAQAFSRVSAPHRSGAQRHRLNVRALASRLHRTHAGSR